MSTSAQGFSLDFLESSAVAFLDYAETLGRPLIKSERLAFRWILLGFENQSVQDECVGLDLKRGQYLHDLIVQVRQAVEPDATDEHAAGAPSPRQSKARRMTKRETDERITLMGSMLSSMSRLTRELFLSIGDDQEAAKEVKKMQEASRCVASLGRSLVARFNGQPRSREKRARREKPLYQYAMLFDGANSAN